VYAEHVGEQPRRALHPVPPQGAEPVADGMERLLLGDAHCHLVYEIAARRRLVDLLNPTARAGEGGIRQRLTVEHDLVAEQISAEPTGPPGIVLEDRADGEPGGASTLRTGLADQPLHV